MRYLALATDYDGTLSSDGHLSTETMSAVKRLGMSERRALLVTGRRPEDLMTVAPSLDVFDHVVAENGALIYTPSTRSRTLLGPPPSQQFIEYLEHLNVPFQLGRS